MHVLNLAVEQVPMCQTGGTGVIAAVTDWLVSLMEAIGGIGVAFAIAAESIFPPIPSEIVLPLAGFTAAQGHFSLFSAILWATLGSLAGAWALYGIAHWVGLHRIHKAVDKIPGISRSDIESANSWFERWGMWSIMIGRVVPVVRSLISIPAGLNAMSPWRFTLGTFAGSALWNTVLVTAGYVLGDRWCSILSILDAFESVVIFATILAIVIFIVRKIIAWRNSKAHTGE